MNDNKNILRNCNVIDQVSISNLLDGRTFFIPSYQRGYRWTKTQIYDLCNDLLEYALKPAKDPKSFYSLQPLIVRKTIKSIVGKETEVYEVIDGQQRLTSIYILYRLLMVNAGITSSEKQKQKRDAYHIYYETRPNDYDFIENLGLSPILNKDVSNIDIAHIANSYHYIWSWLSNNPDDDPACAKSTWSMFSRNKFTLDGAAGILFNMLNNDIGEKNSEGNAQFVWYEIDASKDAIQEFLSENKGKIRLTNTEKIRALFMQRRDKDKTDNLIQLGIAKDWELIENTLHRNSFWSFISNEKDQEDGRIDLIFRYIYDRDCKDKTYQGEDKLFRYYYNLFNKHSKNNRIITEEWNKVMEAFRMIQNWYQNPRIYNLVGLLTKEKNISVSTKDIADIYDDERNVATEDFIHSLKEKVCREIIDKIPVTQKENESLDIKEGEKYINLFFNNSSDKSKIPGLLRFLNVNLLSEQIEKLLKDVDKADNQKRASDMGRSNRDELCSIYRFPFEALDSFGWDIEHIDSATTNSLINFKDQQEWIKEAEETLGEALTDDKNYLEKKRAWAAEEDEEKKAALMSGMLEAIKNIIGEDDSDERKNWIGNLTLLDCGTNRLYKNKIFALKRQIIHKRINRGVFVPVCTQNIFNKTFQNCTRNNLRWDFNDKKCYHQYILDTIEGFKEKYATKKTNEK